MSTAKGDAVAALVASLAAHGQRSLSPVVGPQDASTIGGGIGVGDRNAPMRSRHHRHPSSKVFAPSRPQRGDRHDALLVLRAIFRRFAGELVVQGRLLNPSELLVLRFTRKRPRHEPRDLEGDDGERVVVVLASPDAPPRTRFILRCDGVSRDDPRIGHVVNAALCPRDLLSSAEATPMASLLAANSTEADAFDSSTNPERSIDTVDQLFGFNLVELTKRQAMTAGEDGECPIEELVNSPTFHDPRRVRRILVSHGMTVTSWATMAPTDDSAGVKFIGEEDPRSFVSLGKAQRRLWSNERLSRAVALLERHPRSTKDALSELSSAIQLDGDNIPARMRRGQMWLEQRRFDEALEDFEHVIKLEPSNETALASMLRVKSIRSHTTRVTLETRPRASARMPDGDHRHQLEPTDNHEERVPRTESSTEQLERDRLRKLLEAEEDERRRWKRLHSRQEGSSDDDDDESSDSSRGSRRHKSVKKKHKKKTKKKKKSKSSKTDRREDRDSSRRRHRDERRRRRSRSRSRSRGRSAASSVPSPSRRSESRRSRSRSRSRSRGQQSVSRTSVSPVNSHHSRRQRQSEALCA